MASLSNSPATVPGPSVDKPDTMAVARQDKENQDMDRQDTLTLAKVDRQNQGPWETEYSYGGEVDLHRHYGNCEKNPGHKNFIPVDKFSIEDLPQDYRNQDMVDFIRAVSDLTVRVTVKYVSNMRPVTGPGSYTPYPGYNVRGKLRMTAGTGYVEEVEVYNGSKGNTCKCKDCSHTGTPASNFAIIRILTVKHNVFDDSEAEHTACDLFFDRGNIPDACSGVITLTGMSVEWSKMWMDHCMMIHYTHDLGLAQRLHEIIFFKNEQDRIYKQNYRMYTYTWRLAPADKQPFCFIVSHPHGCSKQISLGGVTCIHTFSSVISTHQYSTATCPGSSGARVFMMTRLGRASHCGEAFARPGMNYCNLPFKTSMKSLFKFHGEVQPVSMEMLQVEEGSTEYKLHCGVEEGLHKHYDTCQKNPGHQNFFPVEKFSMDNLPLSYRKPLIMEYIKLISDVTVRVSVKYVSEERPETVPGTDSTQPWHSSKGSNQIRVGSGWVWYVSKIMNAKLNTRDNGHFKGEHRRRRNTTCGCKECQNSPTPKTKFAHITIQTASEFNYIRPGRDRVTCLMCHSSNTPGTREDVILTDLIKIWGERTSMLVYVTHDLDLADRLRSKIKTLSYFNFNSYFRQINKAEQVNPGQEPPLYIVISYPHGRTKQVSIGYHGNGGNSDTEENWSPYTRITCPGSIGAPTCILGEEYLYHYVK